MVETVISQCIACQATVGNTASEPLHMTPLPKGPWTNVSLDFSGPYRTGEYILVVIDDYSRYAEIDFVSSTSAKAVIPKLDRIFSAFGIPEIVRSDNGPPFNGNEFKLYSQEMGFEHRKVTPLWPKANGEVERFMQNINKTVTTAIIEGKNWKQHLFSYLRNYRATPHGTTKISPYELMFARKMRVKLPQIIQPVADERLINRDAKAKENMKLHAEKRLRAIKIPIELNDLVLVKNTKMGKGIPKFNPKPYKVVKIKGSMITATNAEHTITRNVSFFKFLNKNGAFQKILDNSIDQDDDYNNFGNDNNEQMPEIIPENNMENQAEPDDENVQVPDIRRYPIRQNRGQLPAKYR